MVGLESSYKYNSLESAYISPHLDNKVYYVFYTYKYTQIAKTSNRILGNQEQIFTFEVSEAPCGNQELIVMLCRDEYCDNLQCKRSFPITIVQDPDHSDEYSQINNLTITGKNIKIKPKDSQINVKAYCEKRIDMYGKLNDDDKYPIYDFAYLGGNQYTTNIDISQLEESRNNQIIVWGKKIVDGKSYASEYKKVTFSYCNALTLNLNGIKSEYYDDEIIEFKIGLFGSSISRYFNIFYGFDNLELKSLLNNADINQNYSITKDLAVSLKSGVNTFHSYIRRFWWSIWNSTTSQYQASITCS